jgi:hypothetical protein
MPDHVPNQSPSKYLRVLAARYQQEFTNASNAIDQIDSWTDEQVERSMFGHAMWDDPPDDWGREQLLIWSRGYLYGRAIQAFSDGEKIAHLEQFFPPADLSATDGLSQ